MQVRNEPTKANLIRLRREAALARQGLEILDRKREILMRELSACEAEYEERRERVCALLSELYLRNRKALAAIGPSGALYETMPLSGIVEISAGEKRIMGVRIPVLHARSDREPFHPLSPPIDAVAKNLAAALPELVAFMESVCAVRRITREVEKTRKREKAIEEIHLPLYEREIGRITSALDENEREELVRYKRLKRNISGREI